MEAMSAEKAKRITGIIQTILFVGLLIVAGALQISLKSSDVVSVAAIVILTCEVVLVSLKSKNLLYTSIAAILAINIMLSGFYYPELLKYQPQNDFGRYIHDRKERYLPFQFESDFATAFYSRQVPHEIIFDARVLRDSLQNSGTRLIISGDGLGQLNTADISYRVIAERKLFPISQLNLSFLNPAKRESVCKKVYLLQAELKR